jgi:hypothetical protein
VLLAPLRAQLPAQAAAAQATQAVAVMETLPKTPLLPSATAM